MLCSDSDLPLCNSDLPYWYSKEKIDIYRFLTFDGIMLLGDSRMKHYWNEDDECFEMCRLHWILQNKVPRTMDIWMVHVPSTCQ